MKAVLISDTALGDVNFFARTTTSNPTRSSGSQAGNGHYQSPHVCLSLYITA